MIKIMFKNIMLYIVKKTYLKKKIYYNILRCSCYVVEQ